MHDMFDVACLGLLIFFVQIQLIVVFYIVVTIVDIVYVRMRSRDNGRRENVKHSPFATGNANKR